MPGPDDFALIEEDMPDAGAGEVVTRTIWLSIDPYMRGRLSRPRRPTRRRCRSAR